MSVQTDRKFDIPAKTIREAIRALHKAGAPEATVFAYASSAQELLNLLVEQGWTISPPDENA